MPTVSGLSAGSGMTATPQFGLPDPSVAPINFIGVVQQLNALALASQLGGTGGLPVVPIQVGSTTPPPPPVGTNMSIWFVTDPNGRPLEIRLYYTAPGAVSGWRRFYTGKSGQIEMFSGNPAAFFDANHLGKVNTDWDGWQLCTPLGHAANPNLVPDLSDKFIVGSGNFSSTFGWTTKVSDGLTQLSNDAVNDHPGVARGNSTHLLLNTDLPGYTLAIQGHQYNAVQAAKSWFSVIVDNSWAGALETQGAANPGGTVLPVDAPPLQIGAVPPIVQTPLQVSPPYFILAYAAWIGYS
jgi:hypothetical protein